MDYSERFKRYSRSDSKDSRSKLGSKDSRNASIPPKPGSMESNNTAYTQGSRTSQKEAGGEPVGRYRDSDVGRRVRDSGDVNRGSGEMNLRNREPDYNKAYREGGEYNGNKTGRGGGETNSKTRDSIDGSSTKQASKSRGKQTKEPVSQREALVPLKTGRTSPGKLSSPRKLGKGEIPHNHPDRSSYHFEGKGYFDPAIYIYPTSDNVPRSYLEEKEMECMAKDETIRMLNSKIRRLEHLLQLKDTRMLDLQGQIAREQGLYYVTSRKHVVK
ncbi:uncharacterized protein LOC111137947 isoform X14 [Crassostrea virginica]|uniref:Uncharacterized protein LOC111137947 isoform X10 n=1 Tax=Crassostrea virginica TaxID=6565 RepID=A0A8B8F0S5_CRAVI|nr:uncharacterized protein LOC111137947 isoform X10 [Crassostrea virginica]